MEKRRHFVSDWIDARQVTRLFEIAIGTGESEVIEAVIATMFAWNDVFDMEWD